MSDFKIGNRLIGDNHPCYFIAEIGANHDGSLERAKKLIELAKQAGADCAKFQHYRADTLCSRGGFEGLNLAHYTDNPYDVFKKYELPWEWTPLLKEHCDKVGIEFMSTPYDLDAVDHLEPYVNAYKIGSGDITYLDLISRVAAKKKPIILSTGASTEDDVQRALETCELPGRVGIGLLHCNTNYDNIGVDNTNLLVIEDFLCYVNCVAGLSYHSTNPVVPVAAVALGAKIIERHFTDGESSSPDNPFASLPEEFQFMIEDVRETERALGDGIKKVEENEQETVVLQRRCLRAARDLQAGTVLAEGDLAPLRPAPADSLAPYRLAEVAGKLLLRSIRAGDYLRTTDL